MEQPIVAYLEAEGENLVVRFNDEFGDAVLFVAQHLGGHADATKAEITAIDPEGIDALVTDASGEHPSRIDFGVDVTVMAGAYPDQVRAGRDVHVVVNPAYTTGNMVSTLRFSLPVVPRTEPVLVAYGDIVFSREVLGAMLAAT